jgi:O-antigen ligase
MSKSSKIVNSELWREEIRQYPSSYLYQPVHNVFLIIKDEIGILGFLSFMIFLAVLAYNFIIALDISLLKNWLFLIAFLIVIVLSVFDHFTWTIQQGGLLFWLFMGVFSAYSRAGLVVEK